MSQLLANTVVTAAVALLVAISFSLIYWVGRFFHFALGGILVVGAYLAYALHTELGSSIIMSVALAAVGCAALGAMLEWLVHRPLRSRGASSVTLLLASLGVYVILINLVTLMWGEQVRLLLAAQSPLAIQILGARLSPVRLMILFSAGAVALACWLFLKHTGPGKVFRAVASNPEVARICGIVEGPVQFAAIIASSVLGAYVGVLAASDGDLRPGMGLPLLILGVATALIGEGGGVAGLAAGAFMVSVGQTISVWFFGMQWRDAATLILLLVALFIRHARGTDRSRTVRERA